MDDESLLSIQARHRRHCEILGAPFSLQTSAQHDGSAHVEHRDCRFHYVVTERGTELERRTAKDEDEILYWLASSLVFDLACKFELRHRRKGQSFRRLLFAKEIELMGLLSAAWAERKRGEIEAVLQAHPYDDVAEG